MTSRRLALLTSAVLDTAFSLALRLGARIVPAASAPARKPARSTPSHSLRAVERVGLYGSVDPLGRPERAGRVPVSPAPPGSCLYSLPPLADRACHSNWSRSPQIPLLVAGLETLHSAFRNGIFATHRERLGRGSLNPSLSLRGGVA